MRSPFSPHSKYRFFLCKSFEISNSHPLKVIGFSTHNVGFLLRHKRKPDVVMIMSGRVVPGRNFMHIKVKDFKFGEVKTSAKQTQLIENGQYFRVGEENHLTFRLYDALESGTLAVWSWK